MEKGNNTDQKAINDKQERVRKAKKYTIRRIINYIYNEVKEALGFLDTIISPIRDGINFIVSLIPFSLYLNEAYNMLYNFFNPNPPKHGFLKILCIFFYIFIYSWGEYMLGYSETKNNLYTYTFPWIESIFKGLYFGGNYLVKYSVIIIQFLVQVINIVLLFIYGVIGYIRHGSEASLISEPYKLHNNTYNFNNDTYIDTGMPSFDNIKIAPNITDVSNLSSYSVSDIINNDIVELYSIQNMIIASFLVLLSVYLPFIIYKKIYSSPLLKYRLKNSYYKFLNSLLNLIEKVSFRRFKILGRYPELIRNIEIIY